MATVPCCELKILLLSRSPANRAPATESLCARLAFRWERAILSLGRWPLAPEIMAIILHIAAPEDPSFRRVPAQDDLAVGPIPGTGRQLLPALKYFTDGQQRKDLRDALLGIYTFITSGAIEDMDAVK